MIDVGDPPGRGDERSRIRQIAEYAFDSEAVDAGIVAVRTQQDPHGGTIGEQPP